jgi:N-methylhydantoinase A
VIGERQVFAAGRWQTAQIFDRMKLPTAVRLTGPAIVQQIDATTVIEPGAVATVDAIGNLRIAVGSPA